MWFGRATEGNSLTPFQAFATGLASRVGVGNIGGVATAIALGGEGAVFWMWVTAFIGMSSAFAESTLAQLFKVQDKDGSFRGGPAYYIIQFRLILLLKQLKMLGIGKVNTLVLH